MSLTILEILSLFAIYAFAGWCTEVIYATMNTGKFVNRGFLNGPLCPIYGFGVVTVVLVLTPINDNLILLFLGSVLLTSVLELVTGAILERFFHQKWWDYSDEHFNLKGYVCLKFSLLWGLACVFVMQILQPVIMHFIHWLPQTLIIILLSLYYSVFFVDAVITIISLFKLQKQLTLLAELEDKLNKISEVVGEKLSDGTLKGMQEYSEYKGKFDERYEKLHTGFDERYDKLHTEIGEGYDKLQSGLDEGYEKLRSEFEQIKARYEKSIHKKSFIHVRIKHAFPKLKLPSQKEMLEFMDSLSKK